MDDVKAMAIVKRWIDRQLDGEIPNVVGRGKDFPIQVSPTFALDGTLGVGVICRGGEFWLDDESNAIPCKITKDKYEQ